MKSTLYSSSVDLNGDTPTSTKHDIIMLKITADRKKANLRTNTCKLLHTCVAAAGSFTVRPRGFLLFRWVRNYGYAHGVRKTLSGCQQNPILFGQAGLTTPTRLGSLFQLTFPVTSRHNGNYDSNTKCKGHQYGSDDSSRCRLHHASNTINSITTQKQLYLTRKTVGTSGTVPGEHTVGQTRLTVRLAVGSQRTASRSRRDLL